VIDIKLPEEQPTSIAARYEPRAAECDVVEMF
jgi:hypothetical protein